MNFTLGMTSTEMQTLINAQPKNLNGYVLTFQIADGEHTLTAGLRFNGFSNGILVIQGNATDYSLGQTKSASLTFTDSATLSDGSCINCNTSLMVILYYLHVRALKAAKIFNVIRALSAQISGCSVECYDTSAASLGVDLTYVAAGQVSNTYYKSGNYGLRVVNGGPIQSSNGASDATTRPNYGIYSSGGIILKSGTQPAGAIGDGTLVTNGGQIL
ncbi:hypothetical protein [Megalodesulfovibrio gigas]|uniref:hypothetical protein n=1 Tax=Megalodesulfovibrio gigas TaxID=879 RepID=UPI001F445402|nr:hypothetical protein [Megalodesulfovibrio gigas]